MRNLLYSIAVLLVIAWAISFFGFNAGGLVHLLLVVAVMIFLLQVIRGKESV